MRTAVVPFAVAAVLLVACSQEPKSQRLDLASTSDVAAVQKRVATVEADLLAAQKALIQERELSEDLRRRLVAIESRFDAAGTPLQGDPEPAAAEPVKRGGLTFYEGSAVPTPVQEVARVSSPAPRSAPAPSPASSDPIIRNQCAQKWGDDFRMRAYCEGRQEEAKAKLAARTPSKAGIWGDDFETIRRGCAAKWGDDFSMREYCEQQQSEAYRKVNPR